MAPSNRRVLVVDDDEAARALMATVLGDAGYAVRVAADGAEAIGLLRAGWRPDAVVLDAVMPGADAAVFRAVQVGLPSAGAVPVLLVSGHHPADLPVLADELGA